MNLYKIEPGSFMLDGGATFGVVPKKIWKKVYPADENNLCHFALRNLLIDTGDRLILIDTGIGNKQDEKFYQHYFRQGHHSIEKSIEEAGFSASDITDVVLTHLHFDHVGGAVKRNSNNDLLPVFKNAKHHVSRAQWEWAIEPNPREKPSFLDENILPLFGHQLINFIEKDTELAPGVSLRIFNGHTAGLLVPFIEYKDRTIVFPSDLLALSAHIPSSWVCGYDTRPLISFEERNLFLKEVYENNYFLLFQHDYYTEVCSLKVAKKGYQVGEITTFDSIL